MKPRLSLPIGWIALVLLAIPWLTACSRLPSTPGDNGYAQPQFVTVNHLGGLAGATGSSDSQSSSIDGALGGRVSCQRFTLDVPPGAFEGTATVTIHVPDVNVLRCDLSITPESANQFLVPVTLKADLADTDALDPSNLLPVWHDQDAGVWREVPGWSVAPTTLVIQGPLSHFSEYGIIFGTKGGW
jgi:hypothetical protein